MTDEQQDNRPATAQQFDPRQQQNIEELLKTRNAAHRERGDAAPPTSATVTSIIAVVQH